MAGTDVLADCLRRRGACCVGVWVISKSAQALLRKVHGVPLDNLLSKSTLVPSLESIL